MVMTSIHFFSYFQTLREKEIEREREREREDVRDKACEIKSLINNFTQLN